MDVKHTPGPWTYEGDHTHRQYNIRVLGRDAQHICTVNNLPPHVLANREQSTAEANARLIAAAPDLLVALKCIADALSPPRNAEEAAAIAAALAAIAKAKGE